VEDFSQRFHRPPDRLGPQQIREYQAELFKKRKLAPSSVTVYLAALRFFYTKTLKKGWSAAETPYGEKTRPGRCPEPELIALRTLMINRARRRFAS